MKEKITLEAFMNEVSQAYKKTASLQKTADELNISYAKVRKILITLGEYKTDFSIEVGRRRDQGKSISEIASELDTSTNRVTAFLPYEKNLYSGPVQTTDSRKSKEYRERIETAREKFVIETGRLAERKYGTNDEGDIRMNEMNRGKENGEVTAIRLHLELKDDYLGENEKTLLRKYGGSSTGSSIGRDILIPSDMPLHNLHYAIQRLFGWQNSHLRKFVLPKEIYEGLTGGTVKGWADLVGVLFQPPGENEHELFWDDDYRGGSIKTWLQKKYTGPYVFRGVAEDYNRARAEIEQFMKGYPPVDVFESFSDFYNRSKGTEDKERRILKRAPLVELTLEEMADSLIVESGTEDLLERLEVAEVLACKDELVCNGASLFPVTDKLIYNYDFGDNWTVMITKEKDCTDLLRSGYITKGELADAEAEVLTRHKPICLHRDGAFVLEDVGGLPGFIRFLEVIHEGEDEEERRDSVSWAKSLGWSGRKISTTRML